MGMPGGVRPIVLVSGDVSAVIPKPAAQSISSPFKTSQAETVGIPVLGLMGVEEVHGVGPTGLFRLHQLDCAWKTPEPAAHQARHENAPQSGVGNRASALSATPLDSLGADATNASINSPTQPEPAPVPDRNSRLEDVFDFASFLWSRPTSPFLSELQINHQALDAGGTGHLRTAVSGSMRDQAATQLPFTNDSQVSDAAQLREHFAHSDAPPIIAQIETRSGWTLMRDHFLSMTRSSLMVHYAVSAFASLQLRRGREQGGSSVSYYYDLSETEIAGSVLEHGNKIDILGANVNHVLTALFLLTYIDLVTNKTACAHTQLRRAHRIVSDLDPETLEWPERRLISWYRLLDARAVTAGGEGLFLRDGSDSPEFGRNTPPSNEDAEAVVADMLSKPLQEFFQKTQLFMGRITQIDLWHRSRGTVEDETEVMTIAAQIQKDNHALYRHRPPILDLAVAGSLQAPLLASSLATELTRSARVALANYHASFIHLHRVAYRHLPRTTDVINAMVMIKQTIRHLEAAQTSAESLPVNMLWPLLMWGAEEDCPEERTCILSSIRKMSNNISNASITADVLQSVIERQDACGQRVDIRTVMHEIYNSCFAVV
ncbi:hypothetical protein PV08_05046 [Exophiala spinifera]|uniref:Transcription factor domain-containing protein n=1 Tax=Exophiala spinifera TaxID=91928 RepID=A0A0D1YRG6_9EURO|nr:uncharacterized protein PV08_05046 [Exophiala spinifera]KIW17851.1 hypothetical protein PV08_05046 [Exophiala spinifera]